LIIEVLYPHQQVKVVAQQAIGVGLDNGLDIVSVQLQEIAVIALLDKEVFPVVVAVIDVIIPAPLQGTRLGHGFLLFGTDLTGGKT